MRSDSCDKFTCLPIKVHKYHIQPGDLFVQNLLELLLQMRLSLDVFSKA